MTKLCASTGSPLETINSQREQRLSLGGKSKHPLIAAKRKRMPFIGAVGVLLLIPSAIFLNHRAQAGRFDAVFYAVQALELLGGLTNLALMGLNIRDGLAIRRHQV